MSLRIAISLFFLITLAHSLCLNQLQVDGKCTQCIATEVLISGFCSAKLRGCMRYAIGPICIQCQFGYILNRTTCVRQAEFNNNTNLTNIPPVVISNPTLTLEDIRNKIGEQFGAYAGQANTYFTDKYPQANKSRIVNVDRLQTKKGVFISLDYQGPAGSKYQAIAFVNNSGSVKEWSFGTQNTVKNDPITANNSISAVLGDKLKDNLLYQMNQQGDIYIFDYMNSKFDITRVIVNKGDIGSTSLSTKLRTKIMSLADLVQQMLVIGQYPNLKDLKITQVQKYDDYQVISFSPTLSVSFKFSNYNFNINKPLDSTPATSVGYTNFTNYTDSRLIAAIEFIAKQFPQVIGSQLVRVQSQVNNGINFLINLKKSIQGTAFYDQYQFRIAYKIDKSIQVIQAKKNAKILYSSNYNYNMDTQFFWSYKSMQQQTNIINIPPIDSVTMKNSSIKVYYQVFYSANQYSEFQYYPDKNHTIVLSYTVDGENLLDSLLNVKPLAQRRTPEVLLAFLQGQDSRITTNAKIKDIIVNLPTYNIIVATSTGTYMAVVQDNGGSMNLVQLAAVSNLTCFTMQVQQVQVNSSIKAIDNFLKTNYPLTDFNLQMVQINVPTTTTVGYRLLYTNPKLKQVQIYLEENNGTASVTKASFTNYGFAVADVDTTNVDVAKIINYIKSSNLAGNKIPFFVQTNGTIVKAYYDDGKSVTEILYDKSADKITTNTAYTRNYLLVPDGFSADTLLLPGSPSSTQNATITKIMQQALKKYSIVLQDASIEYVDRKSSTSYLFMYKNIYGYLRLDATIDAVSKAITFGRLVITGYKSGDFSNCQRYQVPSSLSSNSVNKCLSCDKNIQVEFQGGCHKILDGCLIQAGPICVKCNADYVKSAYKCYRECSFFFK